MGVLRRAGQWRVVALGQQTWAVFSFARGAGLAAEASFWLVFALPWLLLSFVASVSFLVPLFGVQALHQTHDKLQDAAEQVMTPETVDDFVNPLIEKVFHDGWTSIGIVGLAVAIWSGSGAVMTFVDGILSMDGRFVVHGYITRRLLAIGIFLGFLGVVVGAVGVVQINPVVLHGIPGRIGQAVVSLLLVSFLLTALYHFGGHRRLSWRETLPGALLTIVGWALAGVGLGFYIRRLFRDGSVYGVLAAPLAVLVTFYVVSLLVFMGAALNIALAGGPLGPVHIETNHEEAARGRLER